MENLLVTTFYIHSFSIYYAVYVLKRMGKFTCPLSLLHLVCHSESTSEIDLVTDDPYDDEIFK